MENDVQKLIAKIKALRPPGGRMARWPAEIKTECVRLIEGGFSLGELSKVTGIWTGSLHDWRRKAKTKDKFKEVRIKSESTLSPAPVKGDKTFTVYFSTGPRIERVTLEDLRFFKDCGLI